DPSKPHLRNHLDYDRRHHIVAIGLAAPISRSPDHQINRSAMMTQTPGHRTRIKDVKAPDVIITGAGIIGVSLALELRHRGAEVLVLDQGEPGREASIAAAGMLAAADHETPVKLMEFAAESARLYPEFVACLEALSGMTVDFRRYGNLVLRPGPASLPGHQPVSAADLKRMEPALAPGTLFPFFIPGDTVDPILLMRAALMAARQQGVEVRGHTTVSEIRRAGAGVEVVTNTGCLTSGNAVNCRGSWAGAPIRPRKGQLLSLMPANPRLLTRVVQAPGVYVVPRSSGRIVLGATVEEAGFDKTVFPEAVQGLRHAAVRCIPELEFAPVLETWAGLRPGTPDDLPLMGATEANIFIAAGHFRNGILLAPATAKVMADVILGGSPGMDITAFSPSRF
ncbi:MAG TPA: FAD-dependent oxidoreductase, partial [Candidatus Saccharimonadales bacterium]|nr:FAD-dependent oxidoreductase [Candidatus Saccharimonadales bacterium]